MQLSNTKVIRRPKVETCNTPMLMCEVLPSRNYEKHLRETKAKMKRLQLATIAYSRRTHALTPSALRRRVNACVLVNLYVLQVCKVLCT